jgi:hypothetical protein
LRSDTPSCCSSRCSNSCATDSIGCPAGRARPAR